ncbi:MAG: serine/threonine-protein kinase [Planctomycetota bacterium]|jgi:serine/threonine-protein kinase
MGDSRAPTGGGKRRVFGDYELIARVGKGGMGSVFKARRISTGETVAFKALPPSFAKQENLVARFKREVRILLGLKHENIVQGFDSGSIGNLHYLAMEYVDGRPVSEILAREKRLPVPRVIEIMTSVARALAYAHSEGLIHRDVKPDNILIRSDGVVKLCDLGLAREQADTGFTMIGAKLGTPKYMSPEQVEGVKTIDGRADVYSLGATAYHLLTGEVPHSAPTGTMIMRAQLFGTIQPVRQVLPDADPVLAAVIEHCLAKDPDDRYQTMDELVSDLERAEAGKAPKFRSAKTAGSKAPARSVSADGSKAPRRKGDDGTARGRRRERGDRRRSKAPLLVLLALLAVIAGAAWALFMGPLKDRGRGGRTPTRSEAPKR